MMVHIKGAVNVSCYQTEVIEVTIQMALYSGFSAAINGLSEAKEVFLIKQEGNRK
ncbi:MAG: carboxymuconolactone decarboxylase family protein [Nitrososphaeraceae archaeon]